MTTWQVQRFVIENQTGVIGVASSAGGCRGRSGGVRFDRAQRRQCLRVLELPGVFRDIPVGTIERLWLVG